MPTTRSTSKKPIASLDFCKLISDVLEDYTRDVTRLEDQRRREITS